MFRRILLFAATAALMTVPALAEGPTVDELIANNVKAHGGMDKLKAVKSIRTAAKISLGQGLEAPGVEEKVRPNLWRQEFTLQNLTAVQAYDGATGWKIDPFQGKKDPELMGPDELKQSIEQADFDGPLVDYKDKGNKVELIGKEPLEGTDAYKLKVTLKNGDVRYFYLDADSFLELKMESKRINQQGTEVETFINIGDYKEVDGLIFPYSFEAGAKGHPETQKITIEKIELNPVIDNARFKMPEVKKVEAKPEEKKPEVKK